jgi:hypothetical protein
MGVNTFLDPVNKIASGRIKALANFYYEKETGGARIRGTAALNGVNVNWDDAAIKGLAGKLNAPEYFKPINAAVTCSYNDRPIDMLNMDISDPFDKILFNYRLKTRGVPGAKAFSLDKNALISAQGTGKWPELKGNLLITSKDFTTYGTRIKPKTGLISGTGAFSARLGKKGFIDIPSLNTLIGDTALKTGIHTDDDRTSISLTGELDVSVFDILDKGEFIPISGIARGAFSFDIADKGTTMDGKLDIAALKIEHGKTQTTVSGQASMENKNVTLKNIDVVQPGLNARLNGELILDEIPMFKGDVEIADLKISREDGTSAAKKYLEKINTDAKVNLKNLSVYGINIQHGSTHMLLDKGSLKLLALDLNIPYGTITGSAILPQQGNSAYDLQINLEKAPIEDFIKLISKDEVWLSGTMDINGHIWNAGDAFNGDISFKAVNGTLNRYKLVSNIFSFLNPYKIIKTGDFDLLHKGFPYNHIKTDLTIRDSIVFYDGLYMDSNSVQISAVGKYVLKTNYIDMIMGIEPLETFDKTIGMIPIVGWVLTGNKGHLIIISVRVRGPIDDTSVKYLPANSISTPVQQSLLRVLNLPVDILTKPQDVILPGMGKEQKK